MKSNRMMWVVVTLVVFTTIAITFGTLDSRSQEKTGQAQSTRTPPANPFGDLSKYPIADYDAPDPSNPTERNKRKIKSTRYDGLVLVSKKVSSDTTAIIVSDGEKIPLAIPYSDSSLVIVGETLSSNAFLSNDKSGIYSEYSVQIQALIKKDPDKKAKIGETITIDRTGGLVKYPNGQKVLFMNDWQSLPEVGARYIWFLTRDKNQDPNYKIVTAYQIKDGVITALDKFPQFREFNGKNEAEFMKLVTGNK
jgi:hypothetical protein